MSTVPLDNSWRTNVVELPAYAPLIHELVYYLAGARSAESNLTAGQPLRHRINGPDPGDWTVTWDGVPIRPSTKLTASDGLITFDGTFEPGVYRLQGESTQFVRYFVVPIDPRESDLTPCSDDDRKQLAKYLPAARFVTSGGDMTASILAAENAHELWWLGL